MNALLLIKKMRSFPSLLPNSIIATIPNNSPEPGSTHNDCETWLRTYNTATYRNSLFFRGPLLYSTTNVFDNIDLKILSTPNLFKNKVRKSIFDYQRVGEISEWETHNFVLYTYKGLRAGSTKRHTETVRYTQFF